MNNFQRNIFRTVTSNTVTLPPDPTPTYTLESYMRDGSQTEGTSFHLPYIEYINEVGNPEIFYADKDFDICGSFNARSITAVYYCTDCNA